jgi:hypothetical protein
MASLNKLLAWLMLQAAELIRDLPPHVDLPSELEGRCLPNLGERVQ